MDCADGAAGAAVRKRIEASFPLVELDWYEGGGSNYRILFGAQSAKQRNVQGGKNHGKGQGRHL